MTAPRDGLDRLFSRQVQYSQCNGFLHDGASAGKRTLAGAVGRRRRGESSVFLLAS